ncbi:MAG: hypothetical protein IMZ46_02350 [Acidobacteria bacterium]|nr:hypothetical protein [Acidobacteriota bacterium]
MSDPAIKKRLARAKTSAQGHYFNLKYTIIKTDDPVFCFIAMRRSEIRFVRVVIDRITDHDVKLVQGYEPPVVCTQEIFCQKETKFEIREVRE